MKKKEFLDRISFPTEYNTKEELKSSIVLLFFTCIIFFILSSLVIIFNLFLFSKTLLLGTIAYELILFYLLNEYTKKFIQKEITREKAKKTLNVASTIIFTALMLLTLFTLAYTMMMPVAANENKFISLTIPLFLIVLPTFFWHELVILFKKKILSNIKIIGILILFLALTPITLAQEPINESLNITGGTDIFGKILTGVSMLEKGSEFFSKIQDLFIKAQTWIQTYIKLSPEQTQLLTIAVALVGLYFLLKFLSVIVKWVIVIIIAWVVIQLIIA